MGQMEDFLATLSDEQKKAFAAALATDTPKVEQTPKRRGRPKKDKIILPKVQEYEEEEEDFVAKPKRKVVKIRMEDDDDDDDGPKSRGAKPVKRKNRQSVSAGEKLARAEGLRTGPRPNEFEASSDFNGEKQWVKEDKAALKKGKPATRMSRSTIFLVECVRCHREYEVGAGLAHKRFVCDGCVPSRN